MYIHTCIYLTHIHMFCLVIQNGLILGSIVLGIQLIDLYLVFCVVTSRSASYDSDDDDFGTSGRPLLPRTRDLKAGGSKDHQRPSSQAHSTWNQRMREKVRFSFCSKYQDCCDKNSVPCRVALQYGLDTSSLAQPAQDQSSSKTKNESSSCAIM